MGAGYAFTGLAQNLWIALGILFCAGVIGSVYYVPLISVTQREAPDSIRGRIMSTRFLLVQLALLIGMAVAGPLADRVGAQLVFVTAGVLMISASLLGVAFPALRNAALRQELQPALKATATG